jgi:hypothetical protein
MQLTIEDFPPGMSFQLMINYLRQATARSLGVGIDCRTFSAPLDKNPSVSWGSPEPSVRESPRLLNAGLSARQISCPRRPWPVIG